MTALAFASPRKLPKPSSLIGRVVVLDIAFAAETTGGGFESITGPFIKKLGPRLAAWIDHHDHILHAAYVDDPRFVLARKSEHGACPEMISPELVSRVGSIDTIVCHNDFDGLCSAAKWIRGGIEPYPGADKDARAIDTRTGSIGPFGLRIDRALRGRPRDTALLGLVVRHLVEGLSDRSLWIPIDEAAQVFAQKMEKTREIAQKYETIALTSSGPLGNCTELLFVDATFAHGQYDKTELLLLGQKKALVVVLCDGDTISFAAPFESGIDFPRIFQLSGGMPTLVSLHRSQAHDALLRLGVSKTDLNTIGI